MTLRIFLVVLAISILFTLVTSTSHVIIFGYGSKVDMSTNDWNKLDNMNYKESIDFMSAHSKQLTGFELLKNNFSSLSMFSSFLKGLLWVFIVNFANALITALIVLKMTQYASDIVVERAGL